jgi:hypothetical protein
MNDLGKGEAHRPVGFVDEFRWIDMLAPVKMPIGYDSYTNASPLQLESYYA